MQRGDRCVALTLSLSLVIIEWYTGGTRGRYNQSCASGRFTSCTQQIASIFTNFHKLQQSLIAHTTLLTSQDCMRYLSTVLRHRTINVSPATSRPGATMTTHYAQPVTQVSHPVVKHYQPVIPMLTYPTTSSTPRTVTSAVRREYTPRTPPSTSRADATRGRNADDEPLNTGRTAV